MSTDTEKLTTDRKALLVNLDRSNFGTFAEIGAGQEVARHFFRVGGAAGTIAKTMSAYDMTISDDIYGKVGRYVSKDRLLRMLQHEYVLLLQRLSEKRGHETNFFVFADTVAAQSYKGTKDCHGWLGVRFQLEPLQPPHDIIIHVRMKDRENLMQQQALGVIGVNLMYGAFYLRNDPDKFISSLLDDLTTERIEVDMIEFLGPQMSHIDNRLMSLKLLQYNLTNAIMFSPDRQVLQPSEVLYKKRILVERGSFRPVTHVNVDMMRGALRQFSQEVGVLDHDVEVLYELTLNNLLQAGKVDEKDFIARADSLSALGHTVLISNYQEYFHLTSYFTRYTQEKLAMVVGINSLLHILNPGYYQNLEGGILEAVGKLFSKNLKLFVYPMTREAYKKYIENVSLDFPVPSSKDLPDLVTADDLKLVEPLNELYQYLLKSGKIECIKDFSKEHFAIYSRDVLDQIRNGDSAWEQAVPAPAAKIIKERKMFDWKG